jgi:LmbE family N-acetylglucosaminyl deacetylase
LKKYAIINLFLDFGLIDKFIKSVEYIRGFYRYPKKMVGRQISFPNKQETDILVFAAHPDDDILGLGTTMFRHRLKNEKIAMVYVTNGSAYQGTTWKQKKEKAISISNTRYQEGIKALSLINIPKENVFCLGFPDSGTHRYLSEMAADIKYFIEMLRPKRIYVHCIEGGHCDHDFVSFVVRSVCRNLQYHNIYEWAEYRLSQPLGTKDITFPLSQTNRNKVDKIRISSSERELKKRMLAFHKSQNVEKFYMMGEAIRKSSLENIEKELYQFMKFPPKRLKKILKHFSKNMKNTQEMKSKREKLLHIN